MRAHLEREITRLEAEYLKGKEELRHLQESTRDITTTLLQIEGAVTTLRKLLREHGVDDTSFHIEPEYVRD